MKNEKPDKNDEDSNNSDDNQHGNKDKKEKKVAVKETKHSKDNTKDTTDDGAKSEIHHKNGVDNDDMDIDKENNNEVTLKEKESLITKLEYLTNDELVDVKYIILNKLTLHIDNILILRN